MGKVHQISKNYRLGLYEKAMPDELSLVEKLEATARSGFDYMEISIDETEEKLARLKLGGEELSRLVNAMDGSGISIDSMCLSGHRKYPLGSSDTAIRRRSMEIMAGAIDFAAKTGIRIIQLAGYDVFYEDSTPTTRRYFEDNLRLSVAMAAQRGVMLAIETMDTDLMNTVAKTMSYVQRINSPYLQVYPDIGNIANSASALGADPFEDLKAGDGHIAAMHLKETLPGKYRGIPYGKGHVDFDNFIRMAHILGVGCSCPSSGTREGWTGDSKLKERALSFCGDLIPIMGGEPS